MRYIAQLNQHLLTTTILDRYKFDLRSDYGRVFEKGAIVRLLQYHDEQKVYKPSLLQITPAIPQQDAFQAFSAFAPLSDAPFKYKAKKATTYTQMDAASQPSLISTGLEDDFSKMDPQAAPNVVSWLNKQRPASTPSRRAASTLVTPARQALMSPRSQLRPLRTESSATTSALTTNASSQFWGRSVKGSGLGTKGRTTDPAAPPTSGASTHQVDVKQPGHASNTRLADQSQATGVKGGDQDDEITPRALQFPSLADEDPFGGDGPSPWLTQTKPDNARGDTIAMTEDLMSFEDSPSKRPLDPPLQNMNKEQHPKYHRTMNQQAGSRRRKANRSSVSTAHREVPPGYEATEAVRPDPSPEMLNQISDKLMIIFEPLRIFQGTVSLKAEIGRFIFTKVHASHISIPGSVTPVHDKAIDAMEALLDRGHSTGHEPFFATTISTNGGDADYLASLKDPRRKAMNMWTRKSRRVIYEFHCIAVTLSGRKHTFALEINGETFDHRVRPMKTDEGKVFMQCTRRIFDVQVTVDAAQDLDEYCGGFAKEVVSSLEVE